ncbi:MAG: hypothetical protein QUU85_16800 [Candidatus Eisenbacteria bacterium]|nr:hypothetical protein [Candidatus Eisenbacteria bacterium]
MSADATRAFARHAVATLAYRGTRSLRDCPEDFAAFRAGDPAARSRSAIEILAHVGDLLEWAARLARGEQGWRPQPPVSWEHDVDRFYEGLRALDEALAADAIPTYPIETIFQGPISDALTHIGQIGLLRRLAGSAVRGEVMVLAKVEIGRVGRNQAPPVREFD